MGFLRKLMGQSGAPSWPPPGPITTWPAGPLQIEGHVPMVLFDPVDRTVEVVGEGSYQGTLERIAGGRTENGPRLPDHKAVLLPEPTNPYDVNAIRVVLVSSTDGTIGVVGYLTREHALAYRSGRRSRRG